MPTVSGPLSLALSLVILHSKFNSQIATVKTNMKSEADNYISSPINFLNFRSVTAYLINFLVFALSVLFNNSFKVHHHQSVWTKILHFIHCLYWNFGWKHRQTQPDALVITTRHVYIRQVPTISLKMGNIVVVLQEIFSLSLNIGNICRIFYVSWCSINQ